MTIINMWFRKGPHEFDSRVQRAIPMGELVLPGVTVEILGRLDKISLNVQFLCPCLEERASAFIFVMPG